MKIFLTDISGMDDNIMNKGFELVPDYRKTKADRYKFREDKERSLAAGLLLNYATKVYSESREAKKALETVKDKANIQKTHENGLLCMVSLYDLINEYAPDYDYAIEYVANGKPVYKDSCIHFNLSHAGNYVVCAVADNEIGIDIEGPRKNAVKVAKRFFAEAECEWIGENINRFSRIWTLKEAYAKLTGEGIAAVVSKVEFLHDNTANNVSMYISGEKVNNVIIYELNIIKSGYVISAIEQTFD